MTTASGCRWSQPAFVHRWDRKISAEVAQSSYDAHLRFPPVADIVSPSGKLASYLSGHEGTCWGIRLKRICFTLA